MTQSYDPNIDPDTIRKLQRDSIKTALIQNISDYGKYFVLEISSSFV